MIITLLTVFQIAAPAAALTVRAGDRSVSVPVVVTRSGPMVRSDQVLPPLGARLTRVSRDRYTIEAGGTRFDLTLDLPAVRVGREVVPVGAAPLIVDGTLYFALRVVTDVIPRFAAGYRYDAVRRELARVSSSAGGTPAAASTAPPSVAPPLASAPSTKQGGAAATVTRPHPVDPPPTTRPRDHVPVIVVDAGHGGPDRGMSGPIGERHKMYEADITLAVARRVRDLLQARGIKVIMTRTTDTLIALADRGPHRQPREGRPLRLHSRQRRQPALAAPARGTRVRDVFPLRGQDRRREARRGDGKRGVGVRCWGRRRAGGPALVPPRRHGAEREPARIEPACRDHSGRTATGPPVGAGSRREAGRVPRARHRAHAGRAGGDRIRDQCGGGEVPHERGGPADHRARDRRRNRCATWRSTEQRRESAGSGAP